MSEHEEQAIYIGWCKTKSISIPALGLVYAIPNFRRQSERTAAYMYAEGLQPGFPDTCLPVGRNGYHNLYIEFKFGKNKPTPEQEIWLSLLALEDNLCCVFYDGWAAFEFAQFYEAGMVNKQEFTAWVVQHSNKEISTHIVTETKEQLLERLEHERAKRRSKNRTKGKKRNPYSARR